MSPFKRHNDQYNTLVERYNTCCDRLTPYARDRSWTGNSTVQSIVNELIYLWNAGVKEAQRCFSVSGRYPDDYADNMSGRSRSALLQTREDAGLTSRTVLG